MTFLQMVSNLLLLVPLLVTGDIKVESEIYSHEFLFSLQSEGETLCSCPQHWDVCRGGRSVRAVEQPQRGSSLGRHRHLHPRCPAGRSLPEVAPPLEDPPARGEFSLVAVPAFELTACQEPEQWGPEMFDDEEGVEQADEVILILNLEATSFFTFSKWWTTRQGMLALLVLLTNKR